MNFLPCSLLELAFIGISLAKFNQVIIIYIPLVVDSEHLRSNVFKPGTVAPLYSRY